MSYRLIKSLGTLGLTAGLAAGCTSGVGPNGGQQITLSVMSRGPAGALGLAGTDSVQVGGHTVVLEQVEMVLREVELKRLEDVNCDDGSSSSSGSSSNGFDDDCEEFVAGPMLLDLPLGEGPKRVVAIDADTGTYREVEFEIHRPEDDAGDSAFLAAHPDLRRVSIRVRGRYDGADFLYQTDLNAKQEYHLVPPLEVTGETATNVTLTVDLSGWFVVAGQLVNPSQANKGGVFENAVRDNILRSIRLFEDRDHDGQDDHND